LIICTAPSKRTAGRSPSDVDHVAVPVGDLVEGGRASASAAASVSVGVLVAACGIRIPAMTCSNRVQSSTLPPVNTTDSGRPWPSQARWIFVVGPPLA
jgi:hypothetical protein